MISFFWKFGLLVLAGSYAKAGCYKDHLSEAIQLNRLRAPLYAELSAGQSLLVSQKLISFEKRLLNWNKVINLDQLASHYEKQGVQVICDTYVSMSQTPPFKNEFSQGPIQEPIRVNVESLHISGKLAKAYFSGSDAQMYKTAVTLINELNKEPRLNCLTKHFLESIARSSFLIQHHSAQARAKGMSSPRSLHRIMIKGHILQLATALYLDKLAKPLQIKGLPILCQDVPVIPFTSL